MIKLSAKKVQNDFSFRIVMMKKLIKTFILMKRLDMDKADDDLFRIQENAMRQREVPTAANLAGPQAEQSGIFADEQQANVDPNITPTAHQRGLSSQAHGNDDQWNNRVFTSFNVESS